VKRRRPEDRGVLEEEPGVGDPDRGTRGGESCRGEGWEGRETNETAQGRRWRRRNSVVEVGVLVVEGRIFFIVRRWMGVWSTQRIRNLILWAA